MPYPDGDTHEFLDVPSDIPFKSPDVAATDERWTSGGSDHDLAPMAGRITVRDGGDRIVTRVATGGGGGHIDTDGGLP